MRNIKVKKISENYDKLASPNSDKRLRTSIGLNEDIGEFFYLNVDNLKTYQKQARKFFDENELNQLFASYRTFKRVFVIIEGF